MEKQTPFFEHLIRQDTSLVFVAEQDGRISAFINGRLTPPVYAPGGPVCLILTVRAS